jgi:hypothetical protein
VACHANKTSCHIGIVSVFNVFSLLADMAPETGRMFYAYTTFSHFQITVSNTFYVDNSSATLPESVDVSFSLNPRVYRSEADFFLYPCCFSNPCSSHPCLFVNYLTISFASRIILRLFVVVYSGGRTDVSPAPV